MVMHVWWRINGLKTLATLLSLLAFGVTAGDLGAQQQNDQNRRPPAQKPRPPAKPTGQTTTAPAPKGSEAPTPSQVGIPTNARQAFMVCLLYTSPSPRD